MFDNPEDYIDQDEGYRPSIDWDSHLREPFFEEALPCESCGAATDERRRAPWDPELQVGPCCFNAQAEIFCDGLWPALARCESVEAVSIAMEEHLAQCSTCQGLRTETLRKGVQVQGDGGNQLECAA